MNEILRCGHQNDLAHMLTLIVALELGVYHINHPLINALWLKHQEKLLKGFAKFFELVGVDNKLLGLSEHDLKEHLIPQVEEAMGFVKKDPLKDALDKWDTSDKTPH